LLLAKFFLLLHFIVCYYLMANKVLCVNAWNSLTENADYLDLAAPFTVSTSLDILNV